MPANLDACESEFQALETALVQWLQKCLDTNVSVNGKLLKAKAQEFTLQTNVED